MVKLTAHILRTQFPLLFGVLLLDACKLHLYADVLLAISRAPLRAAIVPPRLTWLLAPLDTHTFASYKRFLRAAVWDSRSGRATGEDNAGLAGVYFLDHTKSSPREKLGASF